MRLTERHPEILGNLIGPCRLIDWIPKTKYLESLIKIGPSSELGSNDAPISLASS